MIFKNKNLFQKFFGLSLLQQKIELMMKFLTPGSPKHSASGLNASITQKQ
jgi:hypothetical protein